MVNKGFAAVYLVGLILLLALGTGAFFSLNKNKIPSLPQNEITTQPTITIQPSTSSSSVSAFPIPKTTSLPPSPAVKAPTKTVVSSPTPSPTPQRKIITVSGFAYEDRTNNGLFDSDDPRLPNMQLLIYDSATGEWINSIYTGQDGGFTVTNTVKGNLQIKPGCNENFCPKDGTRDFSTSSPNQQFAFRSASAPTGNNNGVIEGDLIIEKDRPYKFYLLDGNNNYYSNIEWSGGHFKIQNLPNNLTYIIRISYGDGSPDNTEATLSPSSPERKTLKIYVR